MAGLCGESEREKVPPIILYFYRNLEGDNFSSADEITLITGADLNPRSRSRAGDKDGMV